MQNDLRVVPKIANDPGVMPRVIFFELINSIIDKKSIQICHLPLELNCCNQSGYQYFFNKINLLGVDLPGKGKKNIQSALSLLYLLIN